MLVMGISVTNICITLKWSGWTVPRIIITWLKKIKSKYNRSYDGPADHNTYDGPADHNTGH